MIKNKIWLWIDPTNFCNLSCKLCYTKQSHGKDYMKVEKFKFVIDKLLSSNNVDIQFLHLNWRGESFLNPQIIDFIKYLNDIKIVFPVHMHTNGTIINERIISELSSIDFKIDFNLYFSLDGDSKLLHEKNRGVDTFDKTIQNLNILLSQKRKYKIGIYELIIENSNNNILSYINGQIDSHRKVNPIYPDEEEMIYFKKSQTKSKGFKNIEDIDIDDLPKGPCVFVGNTLAISPLGDVSVCLISHNQEGIIGNVFTDDIEKIMENANAFKNQIIVKGRGNIIHCQKCLKPSISIN